MSYQQFQNPQQENAQPPCQQQPPPIVSSEAPGMMQNHHQNTTTVFAGHSTPAVVMSQTPYNAFSAAFSARAGKTKKFGIAILTIGIITLLFGISMLVAASNWWGSVSAGGIWSGIFFIIAGSLTMGAGGFANNLCLRIGAMVTCILALIFASISGILNLIAFSVGIRGCYNLGCYWDYNNNYVCVNAGCYDDNTSIGSILSLVLFILNLSLFIITLVATINLGRGCCTPSQKGHPGNGTSIAMSTSSTHQQHQQGGVLPGSTPVYTQHHQHQSPFSQQEQYPSQPYQPQQQYNQTPIQPSAVTYRADYHPQGQQQQPISQEEQKVQPPGFVQQL